MAKKQSSAKLSSLAGVLLQTDVTGMQERVKVLGWGEFVREIHSVCASVVSQDEKKGQKK